MASKGRESREKKAAAAAAAAAGPASSAQGTRRSEIEAGAANVAGTASLAPPFNDRRLILIDSYLVFLVAVAVFQLGFALLGGSYPFNAFLGGFALCVAQFVLTVALRINPKRLGEFIFASLICAFVALHFIN